MPLPSINTLLAYKHFAIDGSGFHRAHAERAAELLRAGKADTRVGLAFDEMKLSRGLTFSTTSDSLTGFTDVDAAAYAQRLEGLLDSSGGAASADPDAPSVCRALATHVLHFEVTALGERPTR